MQTVIILQENLRKAQQFLRLSQGTYMVLQLKTRPYHKYMIQTTTKLLNLFKLGEIDRKNRHLFMLFSSTIHY